jgi:signal transduction histidine kinase
MDGKPVTAIIPARFKGAHESALHKVVFSEKTTLAGQSRQMTGLRKNGSEFPLELSLAKWQTNEGLFFTAIIRDITDRVRAEEELQTRTLELGERVKELNCLYGLSNLFERPGISLEEILQEAANLIPPSWQYPDITCARINLGTLEYKTQNFKETAWRQASDIMVHGTRAGVLEVFYLEEKPEIDEGPFLKEERSLINAISERLGRIMELRRASEALNRAHRELEKRVKKRTTELMIANEKLKAEIQEHESTQAQLLHSKAELQTIFDGISDPLLLFDKNLVVKSLNRRAAAYYGIDNPQQCIGKHCHEVFKGDSSPCEGCEVPFAVSNRQSLTFERRNPKNPDRLEQVFVYPVKETDTETGDAIIRISDITEAKRFERQLIHSEKMASLGVLVSSIVHEINNPNNFVTFNIPILRDYLNELMPIIDDYAEGHPDYELCHMSYPEFRQDIFKLIDNLDHGAGRIKHFVQNLRDFSRSTTRAPRQWVDLKPLIDKVFTICNAKIGRTVRSLINNVSQDLPQIHTDPYALEQILINLLINSSQAADKNDSFISVGVAVGHTWQDHILIEVRDNGCGMDPVTREKIFQPFFTTKTSGEGTGLGLYVCLNLIEGLGGRIEVNSEPGEGSTFTVILPDKERRLRQRV